jgi:hypothetical protein
MTLDEMIQRAKAQAESLLQRAILALPPVASLKEALETSAAAEEELRVAALKLMQLDSIGYADPKDFQAYATIRTNLTTVQQRLLSAVRQVFSSRREVLDQLPTEVPGPPLILPGYWRYSPDFAALPGGNTGTRGLHGIRGGVGVAPVAAAAGLAPWMIAAIILVVVAALALTAYLGFQVWGLTVEAIRDVIVTREQTKQYLQMVDARMRVYEDCRAQGGTDEQCARQAQEAVPTPKDSLAELPRMGAWIPWAVGGLVVLVIGAGVYYYFRQRDRRSAPALPASTSGYKRRSPSYRRIPASRFHLEPIDDAGLEV